MNFRMLYLVLAVAGAIVPVIFFIDWIQVNGFDLYRFIEDAFVNGATSGLTALSFALPLYLFVRHLTRPVHAL